MHFFLLLLTGGLLLAAASVFAAPVEPEVRVDTISRHYTKT